MMFSGRGSRGSFLFVGGRFAVLRLLIRPRRGAGIAVPVPWSGLERLVPAS